MAQTATKVKLSGSTDGKAIKVVAIATPGTLIHTATASTATTTWDEIYLWVFNSSAVAVTITVEFGGAIAPDQNVVISVPPTNGLMPIVPGLILQNSATVKVFAASANVVTISGYVHQIV